jgi:uncharacterized membrane protein YtjA (UPF0391 family)
VTARPIRRQTARNDSRATEPASGMSLAGPYRESSPSNELLGGSVVEWPLLFLIIAFVGAVVAITGIAGAAAYIAWIVFFVGLILFFVALAVGARRPPE